jgi:hypothetical protein
MAADKANDGILGALRSELDDSDTGMHKTFETLASLAGTVRTAYLSYRITPEKAAELLQDLRVISGDGFEWTVGATSGTWFRRRTGEQTWSKSVMPIGVAPAPGTEPAWVEQGIAAQLVAAEKQMRDRVEAARQDENAEQRDVFSEGSINPFQRKDDGGITVAETGVAPRVSTAAGDVDWLFEEWDNFDRTRTERASTAAVNADPVPENPTRPALPKNLPADLDPDRSLQDRLAAGEGPVDRAGADHEGGAPQPRTVNPEEFFLPPED